MQFKRGRMVYTEINKEESLHYLYQKFSIFVIQEKYKKFLGKDIITNKDGKEIDKNFFMNFGRLTVPVSKNDDENEQVFYTDLHFLKQITREYNIEKYVFFVCKEDDNG